MRRYTVGISISDGDLHFFQPLPFCVEVCTVFTFAICECMHNFRPVNQFGSLAPDLAVMGFIGILLDYLLRMTIVEDLCVFRSQNISMQRICIIDST